MGDNSLPDRQRVTTLEELISTLESIRDEHGDAPVTDMHGACTVGQLFVTTRDADSYERLPINPCTIDAEEVDYVVELG